MIKVDLFKASIELLFFQYTWFIPFHSDMCVGREKISRYCGGISSESAVVTETKTIYRDRNTQLNLSQCMRFPTMWNVPPAKAQTSMRIRAVCLKPLLVA